jgi:uncharacterized membrane protein
MVKKKSVKKSNKKFSRNNLKKADSNSSAFITTFLSIVGFIIAIMIWKDDDYVMFYAKQSLLVFIVFVVAGVIGIIPIIGWAISPIVSIFGVVLWVISWIYALSGEKKQVPLIGQYTDKINL